MEKFNIKAVCTNTPTTANSVSDDGFNNISKAFWGNTCNIRLTSNSRLLCMWVFYVLNHCHIQKRRYANPGYSNKISAWLNNLRGLQFISGDFLGILQARIVCFVWQRDQEITDQMVYSGNINSQCIAQCNVSAFEQKWSPLTWLIILFLLWKVNG